MWSEDTKDDGFKSKSIPPRVANLIASVHSEDAEGNGKKTDIDLINCKDLYPDLVTDESYIGEGN